jgi:hypothetical protein
MAAILATLARSLIAAHLGNVAAQHRVPLPCGMHGRTSPEFRHACSTVQPCTVKCAVMRASQFSLSDLLVAILDCVLLVHGMSGWDSANRHGPPSTAAGLSLCTFLVSLIGLLLEDSSSRRLVVCGVFYVWGVMGLGWISHDLVSGLQRLLWMVVGVGGLSWWWFARPWPS